MKMCSDRVKISELRWKEAETLIYSEVENYICSWWLINRDDRDKRKIRTRGSWGRGPSASALKVFLFKETAFPGLCSVTFYHPFPLISLILGKQFLDVEIGMC